MRVEVKALSCRYGNVEVLHAVSTSFTPGTTALVGRNGAGKSTLLKALCGVLRPTSGDIVVDGENILGSAATRRRYLRQVGWVPQDLSFPRGSSVSEVIDYAAWLKQLPRRDWTETRTSALRATQLEALASQRIGRLSGGQRRRVSLAAALVGDPDLLVLDEPTAGLDPSQREHFLRSIRAASTARTVILSTHLLEDIIGVADRLLVLDAGVVVKDQDVAAQLAGSVRVDALSHLRNELFSSEGEE